MFFRAVKMDAILDAYDSSNSDDADSKEDESLRREMTVRKVKMSDNVPVAFSQSVDTKASKLFSTDPLKSKAVPSLFDHLSSSDRPLHYVSKRKRTGRFKEVVPSNLKVAKPEITTFSAFEEYHQSPLSPLSGSMLPSKILFANADCGKPISSLKWHTSQDLLMSSCYDGRLCIWDIFGRTKIAQFTPHFIHDSSAILDAHWLDETSIISGGIDKRVLLTDVIEGKTKLALTPDTEVSTISVNNTDRAIFVSGGYDKLVHAWDKRVPKKAIRTFVGAGGKILDVEFLCGYSELLATSDIVRRNAANHSNVVWDFGSGAILSNQIYQEMFTCPNILVNERERCFMLQSNGDYIAIFSTARPYRMNKYKRFEGHKVEGYPIGLDMSANGSIIASGDSLGKALLYDYSNGRIVKTLTAAGVVGISGVHGSSADPCVAVACHSRLQNVLSVGKWSGSIIVYS